MPMSVLRRSFGGLRVLVAGGGVAGLEAMLALRSLARDLVEIELLSAEHDLWYRPYATAEPFEAGAVDRFEVAQLAAAAGATFTPGQLARVDPAAHTASTTRGLVLPYDMLVIACGALPRVAVPGALTFRGPADADLFRRLLDDLERENVRSIAFVQPPAAAWPLPLYELALETGAHLERRRPHEVELALISHEPAPLAALGAAASDAVAALLRERRIAFCADCDPAGLLADRVVALPQLEGQPIEGIPDDADGFVATGESGRVVGLEDVFAAGDITSFPVKQGSVAAQQADAPRRAPDR